MDEQRTTPVAGEDSTAETQRTQRTDGVAEETGDRRQETEEAGAPDPVGSAATAVEETVEETGDRRQKTEEAGAPDSVGSAATAVEETVEETGDRRQETEEAGAPDAVGSAATAVEETVEETGAAGRAEPVERAAVCEEAVEGTAGERADVAAGGEPAGNSEGPVEAATAVDEVQLKAVIEAIVYVAEEPATAAQIANSVGQPEDLVKRLLDSLVAEYADAAHGVMIREVAGGYKLATKPEHHDAVRAFAKSLKPPLKLSLAALETLATIAYKQPITAPEIMEIRGVQGAGVLKTLLDRKLIQAGGRKNVVGRPILYKTTKEFLVQFGLKDLAELPTLKEFEELRRLAAGEEETGAAAGGTGDTSQEAGDRRQETGEEPAGAVEETGTAARETEIRSQEAGEEPAVSAQETADRSQETGEELAAAARETGQESEAATDAAVSTEKDG